MILTIIQARLGSTRLPGKILLPIAGKTLLQHVYEAAPEPKMIAMPAEDRPSIPYMPDICFYNGNPNDVLGRFYHTWQDFKPEADWILRLTADCPMLAKEIVEKFINYFNGWHGDSLLYTIFTNRPWDPDGYDLELFSVEALKMAHKYALDPQDREHVTRWMYHHLNVRRFSVFGREPQPEDPSEKCSIDTMEDYEKVKKLMEGK